MRISRRFFFDHVFTFFVVVLFLLSAFLATKSLFVPGMYNGHDTEAHITRIIAYDAALRDGQFPPTWASKLLGGIGSPVLMLNYQLPYMIVECFYIVGFSFFISLKLAIAVSFFLSCVTAYYCFLQFVRPKAALIGSLVYGWTFYRFVDMYVRAAFGEIVGFVFVPLLFAAIKKKSWKLFAVSGAGLLLSHPVMSAIFFGCVMVYGITLWMIEKKKDILVTLILGIAFACALSAWNVVPTLTLTKETHYTPSNTQTYTHFPTVSQLFRPEWGYGWSRPGDQDNMSFFVGYGLLVAFGCTTLLSFFVKEKKYTWWFFYITTIVCIYFMTPRSIWLWQLFQLERFIDYPWRLLLFTTFSGAFLAAYVFHQWTKYAWVGVLLCTTVLIAVHMPYAQIEKIWTYDAEWMRTNGSADAYGEYAPKWRKTQSPAAISNRVEVVTGKADLHVMQSTSNMLSFSTESEDALVVRVNIAYFPGWNYTIDGVSHRIGEGCSIIPDQTASFDDSGLISCSIPRGKHRVQFVWNAPIQQRFGSILSLCALVLFLILSFRSFFQPSVKKKTSSH